MVNYYIYKAKGGYTQVAKVRKGLGASDIRKAAKKMGYKHVKIQRVPFKKAANYVMSAKRKRRWISNGNAVGFTIYRR